jgi:hypothetical protein
MRKKNEKGFALVLSLVLLMAMSLMGGALIVISASDHQSNNISDEYQQTFYVAETALFEGEKYLLNQYKGPYKNDGSGERDLSKRGLLPPNSPSVTDPPYPDDSSCYNSYSDIDRATFKAVYEPTTNEVVVGNGNYKDFISNNIINHDLDSADRTKEQNRLSKFKYQYFLTQTGEALLNATGESNKLGAINTGKYGMAYRIFGCGIFDNGKIIVPLESIIILPR